MNNPEMLKSAMDMMRTMDAETIASMSRAAGLNMSPDDASRLKQSMEHLSPSQLATLAKWQNILGSAIGYFKVSCCW